MFSRVFNCGNCRANARIVVDLAVFDRDVEIDANEDAPSFKIEISDLELHALQHHVVSGELASATLH